MKTKIKLTVILSTIIILFSCNNDDDAQPEQNIRLKAYSKDASEFNLNYNEDGMLSEIGRSAITYDAESRVEQIGRVTYTYNNQDRVSKILNENGIETIETTIIYNNEGLIASLTSIRENRGITSTIFEYDTQNRLESVIEKKKIQY